MVETHTADGKAGTRISGLPLRRLFGGITDAIETCNTVGGWPNLLVAAVLRDLHSLVDRCRRRVRIKVGQAGRRAEAHRVRAVRQAIGTDSTLMRDANQCWGLSPANRMPPVLAEVGMDRLGKPVHAEDLQAHQRLQATGTIDIAAGESLTRHTRSRISSPLTPCASRRAGRRHPRRRCDGVDADRSSRRGQGPLQRRPQRLRRTSPSARRVHCHRPTSAGEMADRRRRHDHNPEPSVA